MGVDPGTIKMGVGVIEKKGNAFTALICTTIQVSAKMAVHDRLFSIYKQYREILADTKPDIVALEDVYFGKNFKSAIRIGEARCAVILSALEKNIAVVEYAPTRVKSAVCGNGRAGKEQVQHMVQRILGLRTKPQSDAADALALAICHANAATTYVTKRNEDV